MHYHHQSIEAEGPLKTPRGEKGGENKARCYSIDYGHGVTGKAGSRRLKNHSLGHIVARARAVRQEGQR